MESRAAGPVIPPELLARVPGCEDGRAPLDIQMLPGGRGCNEVLRIDTPAGRFVWRRRRGPVNRPGSLAMTELRALLIAAGAELAPPVLDAALDGSWILMPFIAAPLWTEARLLAPGGLERLGGRLAVLHALPVPDDLPRWDALAVTRSYQDDLRRLDAAAAQAVEPLVARVEALSRELAGWPARWSLNHGDLQASNMLGERPLLVDWEYAQVADPLHDLATLVGHYPRLAHQADRLLASAGLDSSADRARFRLEKERFTLLNAIWERIQLPGAG